MTGLNWKSAGFHGSPPVCNSWNSRQFYKQLVKCLCGGVGTGSKKLHCLCYLCISTVLMWNSLLLIFELNSHKFTRQKYVLVPLSTLLSKLNVRPSPVLLSSRQGYSGSSGWLPYSSKYCGSALLAENISSLFRKIGMEEWMNCNNHKVMWIIDSQVPHNLWFIIPPNPLKFLKISWAERESAYKQENNSVISDLNSYWKFESKQLQYLSNTRFASRSACKHVEGWHQKQSFWLDVP